MEVITLAGLVGLGYIVSRATEKQTPTRKQVPVTPATNTTHPVRPHMSEGFSDIMYEPQPGSSGFPTPQAPTSQRPLVELRTDGFEEEPNYVDGDYIISPLTGQKMPTSDFTHNNMTPFFGGRIKQNMNIEAGHSRLDTFTGAGSLQIAKKEIEPMFDTANTPFGNPYGMEHNADFVQSRMEVTRNRAGEKPFEPVHVAPGMGEENGFTGKGGFQQLEINEIMRNAMKTDELRTADKPKVSYNGTIVPGKHYIGGAAESAGEVRQYHPDRYFENKNGERFFVTTGDLIKEAARPAQIVRYTNRPETSQEYTGIAQSQDAHTSYVSGSYKNPSRNQFESDGFHNLDMSTYGIDDTDAANADYGRSGYNNKPNERSFTGERVMGLNLAPAETGATMIHYVDDVRPTRRAETIGNLRQAGMPVGFAAAAPAITVWDPSDIARTTVKEGTSRSDYFGMASSASAPNRLKVYDPDDVARPTKKAVLSAKDYYGAPMSASTALTSHDAAANARLNKSKQAALKRRAPIAGNGGNMNLVGGPDSVKQRSKKLNSDSINDRASIQTRVVETSIGADELGRVKYRVPLVNDDRIELGILGQLESNPYARSLHDVAADEYAPI
jgi:hypothetical protein